MTRKDRFFKITGKLLAAVMAFSALSAAFVPGAAAESSPPGILMEAMPDDYYGAVVSDSLQLGDMAVTSPSNDLMSTTSLPSSVDLSTSKYFPSIGYQQGGSCSAWSTVYYQFSYEAARLNDWDAKSDSSKVFSPKYVWNYINEGYNKGVSRASCIDVLQQIGAVRYSEFPQNSLTYDWYQGATDEQTSAALRQALKTRVSSYNTYSLCTVNETAPVITSNTDTDLNTIKNNLNNGHVLTFDSFGGNWYYNTLSNGEKGILYCTEKLNDSGVPIGHAMTIVGYNDNVYFDLNGNGTIEDNERGALKIANSWGTNASNHNNGYIWVMYDALNYISSATNTNISGRVGFIYYNLVAKMTVGNYNPELTAEVTIEQSKRNDITVDIENWETDATETSGYVRYTLPTFLKQLGGDLNFDGTTSATPQTRIFVFDCEKDSETFIRNGIKVTDKYHNSKNTTVKQIKWRDANGTVLKNLGQQTALSNKSEIYYYGAVATVMTLNEFSSSLYKGQGQQLTTFMYPVDVPYPAPRWESSNPAVVSVDSDGYVTCNGIGQATVTAYATDGGGVSASCEYTINDDYANTAEEAQEISLNGSVSGGIEASGDVDCFKFTPTSTGDYLFYTTGSTDTKGSIEDANGTVLASNDDHGSGNRNFIIKHTLVSNTTYYIKVSAFSTKTGDYVINISKPVYSTSLSSYNQDARCVQMSAEASTVMTTLVLTIGNNSYTLTKPDEGLTGIDTTVNGAHFKVDFTMGALYNNKSIIWMIKADIPATAEGSTDTVSFTFNKDGKYSTAGTSRSGLVAYGVHIKTGVSDRANNSLQLLLNGMAQSGYTYEVREWDNTLVTVTSTTKAGTGLKILKKNSQGKTVGLYFVVVFGDVTGKGEVGDGIVNSTDGLLTLQRAVDKVSFCSLAELAADVDHNGSITATDANLINQHTVGKYTIDQSTTISTVPRDCYFLDPVEF